MKRYHFDAAWSGQQLHENDCLIPWDKGEWVRFKDAQADKAKLTDFINEVKNSADRAYLRKKAEKLIMELGEK